MNALGEIIFKCMFLYRHHLSVVELKPPILDCGDPPLGGAWALAWELVNVSVKRTLIAAA